MPRSPPSPPATFHLLKRGIASDTAGTSAAIASTLTTNYKLLRTASWDTTANDYYMGDQRYYQFNCKKHYIQSQNYQRTR